MNELTLASVKAFLQEEHRLHLESTQSKLCFPILKRIYQKLVDGQRFDALKIEDVIIIDGHHRYVCMRILDLEVETINWTKSPSTETVSWKHVEVVEIDWDTAADIKRHDKIWSSAKMM